MLAGPLLALAIGAAVGTGASVPPPGPPVVMIEGGRYHGSGVVWGPGRVLTALHVVEEMPSIRVRLPGAPARDAVVLDRDPRLDLALLAVEGDDLGPAIPLGSSAELAPGAPVALVGCPARICACAEGKVLQASRAFAGTRYVALAATARPGSSGGAVVDADGALVGIVDLALVREGAVALAIPVERAAARFPRHPLLSQR